MEIDHNVAGWFEIPVINMERAIRFYETVFEYKLSRNQVGSLDMGWFPWVDKGMGSGGSLICQPENFTPSDQGVVVYLTAFSGDLEIELGRVGSAGGKVLMPKTLISPEHGYMGLMLDTEGNRIALHSRN